MAERLIVVQVVVGSTPIIHPEKQDENSSCFFIWMEYESLRHARA